MPKWSGMLKYGKYIRWNYPELTETLDTLEGLVVLKVPDWFLEDKRLYISALLEEGHLQGLITGHEKLRFRSYLAQQELG